MKNYITTIILLLIVTWLSVMKVGSLPGIDIPNVDKPAHFIMYAIVTLAICLDHTHWLRQRSNKWIYLVAPLVAIAYGGLMELVQALIPWRGCSIWDFLANAIGAAMAIALFIVLDLGRRTKD